MEYIKNEIFFHATTILDLLKRWILIMPKGNKSNSKTRNRVWWIKKIGILSQSFVFKLSVCGYLKPVHGNNINNCYPRNVHNLQVSSSISKKSQIYCFVFFHLFMPIPRPLYRCGEDRKKGNGWKKTQPILLNWRIPSDKSEVKIKQKSDFWLGYFA